ncbi:RNA-directed DNA polymerase from mobile element jockey [Trichonephila inaurata madagascariensis]|uniref:RNA-directed DNA polymerase from mobile element jockey n=1 Tax=Trichonephila inaurata madagascariensis TaxID=2747483 RepID=A0A8X6YG19_9ARAC|nr:RNA-directed DNA polymerase from mobile element jockey [Trichonephila inaurata madagascariensis]
MIKLLRVENINILTDAYIALEQTLWRFSTLKLQKNQTDTSVFEKELEAAYSNLQQKKGELTSLGPCPLSNCQYGHATNQIEQDKSFEEEAARFKSKFTDSKINTLSVNQTNLNNDSEENAKSKKNSRSDGFTSPHKVAKKQKILQNYTLGAPAPVNAKNKFQPIAGSAALSTQDDTAMPVVRPKIPPIHLKFTKNYNLILQEIARKFPKASSKYSGEYLKIFTSSPDEHRELTNFLSEKGEQYFALQPIANRPQKVVIKGLPIETDVDDIKKDLTDRGFSVIKVAQLTKAKTKFKLPISCLGHASIIFNAHHTSWGCHRIDNRGSAIKNILDNTDTQIIAPTTPTRFGYNSASTIDFAHGEKLHWRSQKVRSIAGVETVTIHYTNPGFHSINTRFAFPKRKVRTDWEHFRELLSPAHYTFQPITARTGEDVESQAAEITDSILHAHALASKPIRNDKQYYINHEIKSLIKERNRARKTWQFTLKTEATSGNQQHSNKLHQKRSSLPKQDLGRRASRPQPRR